MVAVTLESITKSFRRAGTVLDSIGLRIERGEFLSLLGPSGCGKSTLLRMIAGFEPPTSGRIAFDDRDVTHEPPNRRGIGFVFQSYALFPHLSVAENVAFGLEVRGLGRHDVEQRVRQALADVNLADCGAERIDRLSGGQQQRVALARALVIRPPVLLLDEPLSNLDAALRQDARSLIRRLHLTTGVTIVYVTHDQAEAMAMSDRVAVLQGGRLHQLASPDVVYRYPATRFVADFVGRNNVLSGVLCSVSGRTAIVRLQDGTELPVDASGRPFGVELRRGARIGLCVRPEALRLSADGGAFRGVVAGSEYGGPIRVFDISTAVGTLQVEVPSGAAAPSIGEFVSLQMNESAGHLIQLEQQP